MMILAIDTAATYCSVALLCDGKILVSDVRNIGKGHAEILTSQIAEICATAKIPLSSLDKIGVNIGPGSFTGVRVAVATARALSLALNIPTVGISSLEAIAYEAQAIKNKPVMVVMDAGRDLLYRQDFLKDFIPAFEPYLQSQEDFIKTYHRDYCVAGPFAAYLMEKINRDKNTIINNNVADITTFAKLAEDKTINGRVKPLYLRDADAKPQQNFALARK